MITDWSKYKETERHIQEIKFHGYNFNHKNSLILYKSVVLRLVLNNIPYKTAAAKIKTKGVMRILKQIL